jgi:membrane-bound hydrogenase subunit beta
MADEEKIKEELVKKFSYLQDTTVIKRERRIWVDVPLEHSPEVFDHLVKNMQFCVLSAITGMDEGDAFAVIYHLSRNNSLVLNMKTRLLKDNPTVKTVTPYFPAAEAYERELMDLLGINVVGLPEGRRYPLPDNWPKNDFPLRKDWKGPVPLIKEEEVKNA